MIQIEIVEKIKTQILSSITFFPENGAVYEIMWKNMVESNSPQIILQNGACTLHAG
jgi:hypothetical protein